MQQRFALFNMFVANAAELSANMLLADYTNSVGIENGKGCSLLSTAEHVPKFAVDFKGVHNLKLFITQLRRKSFLMPSLYFLDNHVWNLEAYWV